MRNVNIESERLRKFANDLSNFRNNVNELTSRLNGNLNRLSESWEDDGFVQFKEHFERTQRRLRKFSEVVEQTVPKLERDAQAAEEIHTGGIPNI
jgi:WXG100 family type VII secretion target